MIILEHKNFKKKATKLSPKILKYLKEKLVIFFDDPFNEQLKNHALHGDFAGCRSVNITDDMRLIYKIVDDSTIAFLDIDTHSNLY